MKKHLQNCAIGFVLSIAVLFAMSGAVFAADQASSPPAAAAFADVPHGFWGKKAIDTWSTYGIIQGDGVNFYPHGKITRAEMAVILSRIFGLNETAPNPYTDISPANWYYDALIKVYVRGVMQGSKDGSGNRLARPNDPLTRAEAAVLFARIFSIQRNSEMQSNFKDTDIPAWAMEAICGMERCGYITGKGNGLFDPEGSLTRAEAVQILKNMVKLYIIKPGGYSVDVNGNVIINTPDAVLQNMKITGNLYLAEGIGDRAIILTNVTVMGSTFVRGGGAGKIKTENCELGTLVVGKDGIDLNKPQVAPALTPTSGNSGGAGGSSSSDNPQPTPAPTPTPGNSGGLGGSGSSGGSQPTPTPTPTPSPADEEENSAGGKMSTY